MILYAVQYKGELSNNEWSIVTIHKSHETADEAMKQYIQNNKDFGTKADYNIHTIDTDVDSDIIYDYEQINFGTDD